MPDADAGMTGCNFAVAETGTFVVCTNEGNADLSANVPKLHIASVGTPGPGIAANSVIAALICQCPQLLEEPDQSQTFACRIAGVRRKHPVKLSFPTTQLGAWLNLPLIRK